LWCLLDVDEFTSLALPERMPSRDVALVPHDQTVGLALPGEQCEIEAIADRGPLDRIGRGYPRGKFWHRDQHDAAVRMVEHHTLSRVGSEAPQDAFLAPGECR
jgi:hypothetical protein